MGLREAKKGEERRNTEGERSKEICRKIKKKEEKGGGFTGAQDWK